MADKTMITTGRLAHPINQSLIETFLPYALGNMPHSQFGEKVNKPQGEGLEVKWMRMSKPLAQTTPLSEDVDPSPILPTRADLTAKVAEYGAQYRKSGLLDLTEVSTQSAKTMKWLSDTFALTIDELDKQMLATSATTLTCSSGTGVATDLNATDLDTTVQTLLNQDAEVITPMIGASTKVGTTPIEPSYVGIAHTELWTTFKGLPGWRDVKNYGSYANVYKGERGKTDGIRWIFSSRAYKSGSTYRLPVMGQSYYGQVKIPGGEKVLGYKTPEQAGSDMDRYSVVYWKTVYVSRILDELNGITVICTRPS